jgi:hypothetical protein
LFVKAGKMVEWTSTNKLGDGQGVGSTIAADLEAANAVSPSSPRARTRSG